MTLLLQKAVATLLLAAQAAGMGTGAAVQAAGVKADAAQAMPAGAVVQAAASLHDSKPPVKPTPPTPPAPLSPTAVAVAYPPEPVYSPEPIEERIIPLPAPTERIFMPGTPEEEIAAAKQKDAEEYARAMEEYNRAVAEEKARVERLRQENYAQWKATVYAQWEAECRRLGQEAQAQTDALNAPEYERYYTESIRYAAEYAQYQKDLAQWEIAYAQWEKEQAEAQRKPDENTTAPSTDKSGEETGSPAVPELTPEQLAALQRMLGQNASKASQLEAQRRAEEQAKNAQQLPDLWDKYKDNDDQQQPTGATPEGEARLAEFLTAHPTGSAWDENNTYKSYGACAAFAIQAQQTVFGDNIDYVMSKDPNDVRQYSAVKLCLPITGYHWVFITSVNSDGTITIAEGNVNGKVQQGTVCYLDPNTVEMLWNPAT